MSEPLKRRSLFPVPAASAPPAPEAIAAVAASNGFAEAVPPAPPPTPAPTSAPTAEQGRGRRRQPTGRDHQFTTRLRQDTLDAIYAEANARNIPIAQVIEEAMTALQAQRARS